MALWASDDGSGPKLNAQQQDSEQRYLKRRISELEKAPEKSVDTTIDDIQETMTSYVFDLFVRAIDAAAKAANKTQAGWGARKQDGGLFWATYKAITRRSGVFHGASGFHDFNTELADPMMKHLQNQWEKTFQRKLPHILNAFAKNGNKLLKDSHAVVEERCRSSGHGVARIGMLSFGLRNYEPVFNDASSAIITQVNEQQRDINREFVPVVSGIMQTAYDQCNDESGQGSYKRMKGHMERFVERNKRTMFSKSCQGVKNRLGQMCDKVREDMLGRVDSVFASMQCDYMSLVGWHGRQPDATPARGAVHQVRFGRRHRSDG